MYFRAILPACLPIKISADRCALFIFQFHLSILVST